MLLEIFLFFIGLLILIYSSDKVVDSSVAIANHFSVNPFLVGVLIVGFGTSLPELVTSVLAATTGHSAIALGNVIGSNIANIGLILGAAGLTGSLKLTKNPMHAVQAGIILGSASLLIILSIGGISKLDGIILLSLFALYIWLVGRRVIFQAEHHRMKKNVLGKSSLSSVKHLLVIAIGIIGLWLGARWIVDGVITFGGIFGIGEGVVALTAVAIGTSLPELTVAIQSAKKGEIELLVGNILGSNAMNTLLVLGLSAVIAPIPITYGLFWTLPIMLIFTFLLFVFIKHSRHITIWESTILLIGYVITLIGIGWLA